MQHAALPRTHGSKAVRLRCAADPFRCRFCGQLQLPGTERLEVYSTVKDTPVISVSAKDPAPAKRMFCRFKDWRRIATRFDRNLKSFMAAIALAAIVIWWL